MNLMQFEFQGNKKVENDGKFKGFELAFMSRYHNYFLFHHFESYIFAQP
jgi:hypothetical protein